MDRKTPESAGFSSSQLEAMEGNEAMKARGYEGNECINSLLA